MNHIHKNPKVRKVLLWLAAIGPTAFIVVDKVAHAFGICLGG